MEQTDERFARRVRQVRKFRKMTLEELGSAVGLALNVVSKVELGHRKVTIGEAVAVAQALNVPLSSLVDDVPLSVSVQL